MHRVKGDVHVTSSSTSDGKIAIRAVRIQSKSLRDAIGRAYMERYSTPGALKYAKDLARGKSRAPTIELVPHE